MIRAFMYASIVLAVVLAVLVVVSIWRTMRRAQWPGDSPQYRNHQDMARWIERQLRDDMVNVTIAQSERVEAKKLLTDFYGSPPQIGDGDR